MKPMLFKRLRRVERMPAHDSLDLGESRMSTSPQYSSPLFWGCPACGAQQENQEGRKCATLRRAHSNDFGLWYIYIVESEPLDTRTLWSHRKL